MKTQLTSEIIIPLQNMRCKQLGRHQKGMLNFMKNHKGLQSISTDSVTLKIARSLVKRNLITMNEYNQISLA